MISQLQVTNFKCFQRSQNFEFAHINLFTGINGRGKSSLLQSLLVLAQSTGGQSGRIEKLKFNGRHIDLGNFDDIKNNDTPRSEAISYKIQMADPSVVATLFFYECETDPLVANRSNIEISVTGNDKFDEIKKKVQEFTGSFGQARDEDFVGELVFAQIISRIHYIGADRLGPVKYVDKISFSSFPNVGPSGQWTINVLASDDLPLVHENLYRGNDARTVLQQTQEWLNYILDGAKLVIRGKEAESSVLYMLLSNRNDSHNYKPSNVGFGYSYVLPLVVSGLIAQPGYILIIENPEAHLHPRAQSRLAEFFALVASCGVQVFIESHSEHILNGLRVCALQPNINIGVDDITVHYFNEAFESIKLTIEEDGSIENWPSGFFDQQEHDLSEIFRLSR